MAFARWAGRNPTLSEAVTIAREVGWTPDQGMAGPSSEVALLGKLGIAAKLAAPDPAAIIRDVQGGNPVILDTPGHYFFADGYDPSSGKFHVGNSGTAFKAGAPWLSLDEMGSLAGGVRAALFVDSAQGAPSVATAGGTAPQPRQAGQQVAPGGEAAATDVGSLADRFSARYGLDDPLVLRSLIRAESGGNPNAVADRGNSVGLLQANMAGGRGTGYSADWLRDPANNLRLGMPEITAAYRKGVAQGLSGPDLAVYVGKVAQRPAEGLEAGYGDAYRALASGSAPSGPISPVSGPDYAPKLGMAAQLPDAGSGGGSPSDGTTPSPDNTGQAPTTPNPADLGASSYTPAGAGGAPQLAQASGAVVPTSAPAPSSLQAPAPPEAYGEQPPGPTLAQPDASYVSPLRSGMEGLGQLGSDIGQGVANTLAGYGTPAEQAGAYAMPAPGPHIINNSRLVLDALNYVINGVEPPPDSPARLRSLTAVQELNDVMGAAGEPIARTVVGGVQDALEGNAAGGYEAAQRRAESLGPAGMVAIGLLNPTNFVPLPGGGKVHAAEDVIRAVAPEVADALAREVPQAAEVAAHEAAPAFDRFYHGTGAAFETPDAARFDPNGLYGPAHYLSDTPQLGDAYAETRANLGALDELPYYRERLQDPSLPATVRAQYQKVVDQLAQWPSGPNVRPVDVPRDLKLLDMTQDVATPEATDAARQVAAALPPDEARRFLRGIDSARGAASGPNGSQVYRTLRTLTNDPARTNQVLAAAGYDGIRYPGGQIMPLTDTAGQPIEHTALAIFPESMGKLRNALSGKAGGAASPALAIHAAGALGGGALGYESTPEDQPFITKVSNALAFGGLGLGLAHLGPRMATRGGAANVAEEARGVGLANARQDALVTAEDFARRMQRDLPNPAHREAITAAIENPALQAGLNPAQQTWLRATTDLNDAAWRQANAEGLIQTQLPDYISHIVVKDGKPLSSKDLAGLFSPGGTLSDSSPFFKQRHYQDIPALEAALKANHPGWEVIKDPAVIAAAHYTSLAKASANHQIVEGLKAGLASDGRPLLAPMHSAPPDYRMIDSPSLTKYRYAGQTPQGATLLINEPLKAHPEAVEVLHRLLNVPRIPPNPLDAVNAIQAVTRQAAMVNPALHSINVLGRALEADPLGTVTGGTWRAGWKAMQQPGVPILHEFVQAGGRPAYLRQFTQEMGKSLNLPPSVLAAMRPSGLRGTLAGAVEAGHDLLWNKIVTPFQVGTYLGLRDGGLRRGLIPGAARRVAAQASNNLMGMIPPEQWNSFSRYVAGLGLFAPNFTRGSMQIYRGLAGHVAGVAGERAAAVVGGRPFGMNPIEARNLNRVYAGVALRGVVLGAAINTILNFALSGHGPWSNDPGHYHEIDTGQLTEGGQHVYVANPLFRWEQEFLRTLVSAVPGGASYTGTTFLQQIYNKLSQPVHWAAEGASGQNVSAFLKDAGPHPLSQHDPNATTFQAAMGEGAGRIKAVGTSMVPWRGVPQGLVEIGLGRAGALPPEYVGKGQQALAQGLTGVATHGERLKLDQEQGGAGMELRRLGLGVGFPSVKGIAPDERAALEADFQDRARNAVSFRVASADYGRLSDPEKKRDLEAIIGGIRRQAEAAHGKLQAAPEREPGEPPHYLPALVAKLGYADEAAFIRDAAAAREHVLAYRANPKAVPPPTKAEFGLEVASRNVNYAWRRWNQLRMPAQKYEAWSRTRAIQDALTNP